MRKCQCPAHIAQSAATPADVNNDQVPMAIVDQPVVASGYQQQDIDFPVVNGNTKRHLHHYRALNVIHKDAFDPPSHQIILTVDFILEPAFELRIRCRQIVEHSSATASPSPLNPSPSPTESYIPYRVKDGRVYVEHNHFINGIKVTSSVARGQPFLSTLDVVKVC